MNNNELFNYYSISESMNPDKIIKKLESLKDDGKIHFKMDSFDSFKIEDIDLTEKELDNLVDFLDKNDAIPDIDKQESNMDDDDYDYGDESEDDDNW